MFESHWSGSTTVRSLMAEFPADRNARDVYDQFLWGKGFMIAPIMEEYATERGVYFPPDTWYGYDSNGGFEKYSNLRIDGGKTKLIHADMNTIPLFVRAGTMLVTQGKFIFDIILYHTNYETVPCDKESRTQTFGNFFSEKEKQLASGDWSHIFASTTLCDTVYQMVCII